MDPSRDALIDRFHQLLDPDRPYERDREMEGRMAVAERSTAAARCPRSGTDICVFRRFWLRQGRWAACGFSLARSALGPSRRFSIQFREPGYREDRVHTMSGKCEGGVGWRRSDLAVLRELSDPLWWKVANETNVAEAPARQPGTRTPSVLRSQLDRRRHPLPPHLRRHRVRQLFH